MYLIIHCYKYFILLKNKISTNKPKFKKSENWLNNVKTLYNFLCVFIYNNYNYCVSLIIKKI